MYTLKDIYQELKETLNSDEAEREAQIILESVLGFKGSDLIRNESEAISKNLTKKILDIRDQRCQKKTPLAYILEEAPFLDMKLFVNSDVLVPRPETELMVEEVLKTIKERRISKPVLLDLCTGSGCIAVAIKKALPAATLYASDISKAALNVAAINARKHNTEINFILGDYLDPFLETSYKSEISVPIMKGVPPYFDVIISNPPYVSETEYQDLEPELYHEPKHALVGFPYEHIKEQSKNLIKENGFMALEFGEGQSQKMLSIFPQAKIYKDYAGIDRFLIDSSQA